MKKLTVMRHAEAGQASMDFDRCLTDHGQDQAESTAQQLSELIKPDYLLVSSAARTTETASFLIDQFSLSENQVKYTREIYEASTQALVSVLSSIPSGADDVVMVGHNPAVSSLVSSLTDSYEGFPTGCAIVLQTDCNDWNKIIYSDVTIVSKVLPSI